MDDERRNNDGAFASCLIGCLIVAVLLSLLVAGYGLVRYRSFQAQRAEQEARDAEQNAREAAEANQTALPDNRAP